MVVDSHVISAVAKSVVTLLQELVLSEVNYRDQFYRKRIIEHFVVDLDWN